MLLVVDISRVTYSSGVCQKVRSHRFDVAVGSSAELTKSLEILFRRPALRQNRERKSDLNRRHCVVIVLC